MEQKRQLNLSKLPLSLYFLHLRGPAAPLSSSSKFPPRVNCTMTDYDYDGLETQREPTSMMKNKMSTIIAQQALPIQVGALPPYSSYREDNFLHMERTSFRKFHVWLFFRPQLLVLLKPIAIKRTWKQLPNCTKVDSDLGTSFLGFRWMHACGYLPHIIAS